MANFSLLILFNEGCDMAQTVSRQCLGQRPCSIPGQSMRDLLADDVTLEQLILSVFPCPISNIAATCLTHISFINTNTKLF